MYGKRVLQLEVQYPFHTYVSSMLCLFRGMLTSMIRRHPKSRCPANADQKKVQSPVLSGCRFENNMVLYRKRDTKRIIIRTAIKRKGYGYA